MKATIGLLKLLELTASVNDEIFYYIQINLIYSYRWLKQYQDKSYTNALLAEESKNHYNFIKYIINIPLIISNTAMVCINFIIVDQDLLKTLNSILNSSTGLLFLFNKKF